MGDPLTIAAAGMGAAQLGGSVVSLVGGIKRGQAEQQQLAAREQADRQNQQLAEAQAADALQLGSIQAGRIRMRAGQIIGQQRAGYASSGVDTNSGSAAEVQASSRAMSELDVQTAENNARREAWGHKVTASQYGQQADLDKQAQEEERDANRLSGIGGGLGILGQAAGMFGGLYKKTNGNPFSGDYGSSWSGGVKIGGAE